MQFRFLVQFTHCVALLLCTFTRQEDEGVKKKDEQLKPLLVVLITACSCFFIIFCLPSKIESLEIILLIFSLDSLRYVVE